MAALLAAPAIGSAANVTLTAGDGFGNSSFNAAGLWNNAAAPTAGNDYFNGGFLLRTPADNASYTFGGDTLTITGSGLATGVNNEALMYKGVGVGATITVNNLTINGGQLRQASSSADQFNLAGTLAIGAIGATLQAQGPINISSSISGSSLMRILDAGNNDLVRAVNILGGANTYHGNIDLYASRSRLNLANAANLNFLIGASGINNAVFGLGVANFDGIFNLDLSGAGNTPGDSWTLVSAVNRTFSSNFAVSGFTDEGSGYWSTAANGGYYIFNEGKGTLEFANAVPEPGSAALLLTGVAALWVTRRARRA